MHPAPTSWSNKISEIGPARVMIANSLANNFVARGERNHLLELRAHQNTDPRRTFCAIASRMLTSLDCAAILPPAPGGSALFHKRLNAFARVFEFHELIQIDLFHFSELGFKSRVKFTAKRAARELHN